MKKWPTINFLTLMFLSVLFLVGIVGAQSECDDCNEATACPECLCPFGDFSCYFDGGYSLEAGAGILLPEFNAYPLQGQAPLMVHFQDTTVGGPTEWSWAFGDGDTSTEQNPTHTYSAPGSYSVVLKVTKVFFNVDNGKKLGFADLSRTTTRSQFITVTEAPGAEAEPINPILPTGGAITSPEAVQTVRLGDGRVFTFAQLEALGVNTSLLNTSVNQQNTNMPVTEEVPINPTFLAANWGKSASDQSTTVPMTATSSQLSPTFGQTLPVQQDKFVFNLIGYGFSFIGLFLNSL